MAKQIILPSIGSRGDIQPYIDLASALQKCGYRITVATHPCMRELVEFHEVPFLPVGPDIDIGLEAAAMRNRSFHFMVGMMRVMKFSFAALEKIHEDLLEVCRQADLVVVSHTAAGSMEADKLGLPKVSVTLHPQAIPAPDPEAPYRDQLIGSLAGWGMSFFMSRPLDKIRQRVGLPPMGPEGITSKLLNLIPVSPNVIESDQRWEARHKMTGYWFSDPPVKWEPPEELQQFLATGQPPVVINLGAMALDGKDMLEAATITLEALNKTGLRAIIQGWDAVMKERTLPAGVLHTGPVPHTYLLPRASCFVHHGGFGSTAAAMQAGIPAIVIPHIIDQFIWGNKVYELGIGPKPIPRSKLNAEALATAFKEATENSSIKEKSANLGRLIRRENGLENAVNHIKMACPIVA
jgi:sterol 3beta-glucosyltransferase